jgi:hypothetical protein
MISLSPANLISLAGMVADRREIIEPDWVGLSRGRIGAARHCGDHLTGRQRPDSPAIEAETAIGVAPGIAIVGSALVLLHSLPPALLSF